MVFFLRVIIAQVADVNKWHHNSPGTGNADIKVSQGLLLLIVLDWEGIVGNDDTSSEDDVSRPSSRCNLVVGVMDLHISCMSHISALRSSSKVILAQFSSSSPPVADMLYYLQR